MIETEVAVTHGVARVHVPDYGKKRAAELRKQARRDTPVTATGGANVSGWEELARRFANMDGSRVEHGGERLVH